MCSLWAQLPCELWTLVFRYVSLSDRLRLRASCKHLKELVDSSSLWRNWTVRLRSGDDYNEEFWLMLRRWRVSSARLSSPFCWTQVAKELPGLTILTIDNRFFPGDLQLRDLQAFTNLEHLHLEQDPLAPLEELSLVLPPRVTHIRVSRMRHGAYSLPSNLSPQSQFKKLRSLLFHCRFDSHPVNVFHFFLSSLPQLQHFSLSICTDTSFEEDISELPPLHSCSLSILELWDDLVKLPESFYKMLRTLPCLQSLAFLCDDYYMVGEESQRLSVWLRDLPALTSLMVKCDDVAGFVQSIPPSVTRLTLLPPSVDSEEMTALSTQLPNLHHLHLEPYDELGPDTALIPQLFPGLKTLRLSDSDVPEDVLLSLASLKELEVLETLEVEPLPTALVSKLRALTNNRVRIYNKPEHSMLFSDFSYIRTEYWA